MSLSVERRIPSASSVALPTCRSCGSRLFPTVVGPRCPIHGAEGAR